MRLFNRNGKIQKPFVKTPNAENLKMLTDSHKIPATFISQPGWHNTEYCNKSIDIILFTSNKKVMQASKFTSDLSLFCLLLANPVPHNRHHLLRVVNPSGKLL